MANRGAEGETVTDFIFLGSKITADGDCMHEIKRHLLLGRNTMTNLDRILESRDITLPTEVRVLQLLFFSVIMYGPCTQSYFPVVMYGDYKKLNFL